MQEILDQPLPQFDHSRIEPAGFGKRFLALLIDGIILTIAAFGMTYLYDTFSTMILSAIVQLVYEPYMEYTYGATFGKMVLRIKATNLNFGPLSLYEALLRNVFDIAPRLLVFAFSVNLYMEDVRLPSGYEELSILKYRVSIFNLINYASLAIAIVDGIVLLADRQKRSLHDKIAGTIVIEQEPTNVAARTGH